MSTSPVNNLNSPFEPPDSLLRIAPEPESRLSSIFGGMGSIASSLLGAGASAVGSGDYASLLAAQLQSQKEMQVVSMVSNVEKSKHETQMAAIRNIRVS